MNIEAHVACVRLGICATIRQALAAGVLTGAVPPALKWVPPTSGRTLTVPPWLPPPCWRVP